MDPRADPDAVASIIAKYGSDQPALPILQGRNSLTNEIHPIFRRSNFRDGFEGFRYDAIAPALQLASRFLALGGLIPFWHALLYSKDYERGEPNHKGYDTVYFGRPVLTRQQHNQTLKRLLALAECVTFCRHDGEVSGCSFVGITSTLPEKAPMLFIGNKSKIAFPQTTLDLVYYGSRLNYQWWQFDFAVTLIHELAHAAVNEARLGLFGANDSIFVGPDAKTDEVGLELERELFGGRVSFETQAPATEGAKPRMMVVLREWPNSATLAAYTMDESDRIFTREGVEVTGYSKMWKIDKDYISSMFFDESWEGENEGDVLYLQRETQYWAAHNHVGERVRDIVQGEGDGPLPPAGLFTSNAIAVD